MSEARENAWQAYREANSILGARDRLITKAAFFAGWEERKKISMLGLPRPGYDMAGHKISNKPPEPGT